MVGIKFEMDLAQPSVVPAIRVVQGDDGGRVLVISLLENGEAYTVPNGTTGIVRFLKPDKTGGSYDTVPDGDAMGGFDAVQYQDDRNTIVVILATQVLTVPGIVHLAVDLVTGSTHLHTFAIKIEVEANPGYQATSEGYYNVRGSLPDSGWAPNMYLGTDADGNVVALEAPEGTGGVTDEQVAQAVENYFAENEIETGATAEEAAQIEQNKEDIADIQEDVTALQESVKANTDAIDGIPVAVDDNGYTVITGQERATRIAAVRTEERTTLTFTMQGGEEITGVLEYDDNGLPVSYTENDLTVELGLTGFDDLVVAEWEGGSY